MAPSSMNYSRGGGGACDPLRGGRPWASIGGGVGISNAITGAEMRLGAESGQERPAGLARPLDDAFHEDASPLAPWHRERSGYRDSAGYSPGSALSPTGPDEARRSPTGS